MTPQPFSQTNQIILYETLAQVAIINYLSRR